MPRSTTTIRRRRHLCPPHSTLLGAAAEDAAPPLPLPLLPDPDHDHDHDAVPVSDQSLAGPDPDYDHPSSPLLGLVIDNKHKDERVPLFFRGLARCNPAVRHTDICLTRLLNTHLRWRLGDCRLLNTHLRWRLGDCRNGRLLLSQADGDMCIYDPFTQRPLVSIAPPPGTHLHHGWKCLTHCLLLNLNHMDMGMVSVEEQVQVQDSSSSFRIISLQWLCNSRFKVRAVEYNSGTRQWRVHPHTGTGWIKFRLMENLRFKAMYAAGHIFWRTGDAKLLVLDTSTMEFSEDALPGHLVSTSFAIGLLRDGKGCLACLSSTASWHHQDGSIVQGQPLRLEVWRLVDTDKEKGNGESIRFIRNGGSTFCWKLDKDVQLSKVLPEDALVNQVHSVRNGIALVCCIRRSYAIDLDNMTMLAKFNYNDEGIYPYQVSCPPATTSTVVSRHLGSNEEAANYMDGREGTSPVFRVSESGITEKAPLPITRMAEKESGITEKAPLPITWMAEKESGITEKAPLPITWMAQKAPHTVRAFLNPRFRLTYGRKKYRPRNYLSTAPPGMTTERPQQPASASSPAQRPRRKRQPNRASPAARDLPASSPAQRPRRKRKPNPFVTGDLWRR